jgi:histidine triad (HIT) family protein
MPDCIFCKIIKNEISSEVLFEDERVKVFKDIRPKAPIHFLIVSKKHIASVEDLTEEDLDVPADFLYAAKRVARELGVEGYKLIFNVGRKGGQIVDHIHMHFLGGWGDGASSKELP